ncbi:Beta-1,3-galactosyl-O-glycosyl-glycoprotein beta-1,6-N-acetylglucosaminyltransferase 4 [Chytridiales sp. JEL 0842]|nr:Beta-1,3-galactosyl-O-glycosyl-glycoprotein beta-1,6-N-acetylglucosaminyltransferase 4 [Chytridiales sp. JEL 0842]
MLEGAEFDSRVAVIPLGGSFEAGTFSVGDFAALIDDRARELHKFMQSNYKQKYSQSALYRWGCYSIASGVNSRFPLAEERLLRRINPAIYFKNLLPENTYTLPDNASTNPAPTPATEPFYTINSEETIDSYTGMNKRAIKPFYGVAYLITADSRFNESLKSLTTLIDEIDDGTAIILIQVDQKYPDLHSEVVKWLKKRYDGSYSSERNLNARTQYSISSKTGRVIRTPKTTRTTRNVFMAKHMYKIQPYSSSLLFSNLAGYFELLDMPTMWTHVINLSLQDYPMRTSRVISSWLSFDGNGGAGYIAYSMINHNYDDFSKLRKRIAHLGNKVMIPYLPTLSSKDQTMKLTQIHSTGYYTTIPFASSAYRSQSGWMILAREALEYVRYDWRSTQYLASAEFSFKPDEWFFATVLYNSPTFSPFLINDCKRFLGFEWGYVDVQFLNMHWTHRFKEEADGVEPEFFFLRRVDLSTVEGKELVEWARSSHIRKHELKMVGKE